MGKFRIVGIAKKYPRDDKTRLMKLQSGVLESEREELSGKRKRD